MKKKLSNFFLKDPLNWKFWFVLALVFKGVFFFLRIIQGSEDTWVIHGFYGYVAPDSRSYLLPIEGFLHSGHYEYATRMPGYGVIYFFLRTFCNQAMACNLLILLQYILASASVYVLAKLVLNITNKQSLFYLTFYIFLISSYSNYMDDALMTESLCTSFLVFSTYLFAGYLQNKKLNLLILSGFFLTWVIFLRPVFITIIVLYTVILILHSFKSKLSFVKTSLFFIAPFLVIDGSWIIKNYPTYHKVVMLTPTVWNCPAYQSSLVRFIQAWGGNFKEGDDHSVLFWFGYTNEYSKTYKGSSDPIPGYIYTSKFNRDSLLHIKQLFTLVRDSTVNITHTQRDVLQDTIMNRLDFYTNSIKHEKPFLYYIQTPLKYLKVFLTFHWASYNVIGYSSYHCGILNTFNNIDYTMSKSFNKVNPINWLYMVFNYIILGFGIVGIFLLLKACLKNILFFLFIIIPTYTVIGHAILLRQMDNRYLLPSWPFIIICAAYSFYYLHGRLFNKKISKQ